MASPRNPCSRPALLSCVLACVITACAVAPAPDPAGPSPAAGASAPQPAQSATLPRRAPPMSDPLPPERVPDPSQRATPLPTDGSPVRLDSSCQVDADCAVRNVGNCCGAYPACINRGSPTDPAAVQAQCARDGMASVCGFREIAACSCSQGQCVPAEQTAAGG